MTQEPAVEPSIDVDYVRAAGEEIYARLFPVPKADGRRPYPNPVKVHYQPSPEVDVEIRLIMERTFQPLGEFGEQDVSAESAFVLYGARDAFLIDLSFGKEPTLPHLEDVEPTEWEALRQLMCAITGVL